MNRRGLTTLATALVAMLAMAAVTVGSASANWLYLKGGESKELTENEVGEVSAHTAGTLLVPGLNMEIVCHSIEGKDLLLIGKSTTATGTAVFSECLTFTMSPLNRVKNCDPLNQPIEGGGKAHLILHNGKNYVLGESLEGLNGVYAVVEFSELCALVETVEVTGQAVGECGHLQPANTFVGLDCANYQVTGLLRQAPSALFPSDTIRFGEQAATIDGIAALKFAGALAGLPGAGHI